MANGFWDEADNFKLEALHEALLFAYPDPAQFGVFLKLRLNKALPQLVPAHVDYQAAMLAVISRAQAAGWLGHLFEAALADLPQSPKLRLLARSLHLAPATAPIGRALEDIVRRDAGFAHLLDWVAKLEGFAWRVCRIEYPEGAPHGTGWLVGPDKVLTNWHVVRQALPPTAWNPEQIVCRFGYVSAKGVLQSGVVHRLSAERWCLDASPASDSELGTGPGGASPDTLDYALLRLATEAGKELRPDGTQRGWIDIGRARPVSEDGAVALIVQHPSDDPLQVAPGTLGSLTDDGLRVLHHVNTLSGSSGSPVLDARLEPVALHHAGDDLYSDAFPGLRSNQAIPLQPIVQRLKKQGWPDF